jgi:hypothetical protein
VASLYKKVISGKPYWYLREMGWVDGKPKMVSERYAGTAADIEALLDAREERMVPERTRHLDFGAVAAAWGLLADLGVADGAHRRSPGVLTESSHLVDLEFITVGYVLSRIVPACRGGSLTVAAAGGTSQATSATGLRQ